MTQVLNQIGLELEESYSVKYLCSDFKKKNGYKRSCELSEIYGLYRQNYCGCIYSSLRLTNVKELKIITNSRYLCNKFTHARYRQKRYRCRRTYMCCVYAVLFLPSIPNAKREIRLWQIRLVPRPLPTLNIQFSYVLVELSSFIILSSLIPWFKR